MTIWGAESNREDLKYNVVELGGMLSMLFHNLSTFFELLQMSRAIGDGLLKRGSS